LNTVDNDELQSVVAMMTDQEKIDFVSGQGLWRTTAIERLGIPAIVMTDGTYGVRYSTTQIDSGTDAEHALSAFLAVVNRRAEDGGAGMFGDTRPATCFPNGNLLGCSWDVALAEELGQALAAECQALGVDLLLGPGINIRRTPLAGRAYEYYSEDPVVSGDLSAGLIRGLQGAGVGASLKHFACNNSEIDRTNMSSDVDERALREIYLAGFERAIAKSDPWTVMSAYNPLNGVQSAENRWLLTDVLREEWGYRGVVISDWHAIKDRPAAVHAGTDLDMPESGPRKARLRATLQAGQLDSEALDRSCRRVLSLVRSLVGKRRAAAVVDLDRHHELARRMAAESIVLLKNDTAALPLKDRAGKRLLVVGNGAIQPTIQGSGSATTNPYRVDVPLDEIRALAAETTIDFMPFAKDGGGDLDAQIAEAVAKARLVDTVLVFANHLTDDEGEGTDRSDINLADGQDALIEALASTGCRTIVALTMPDAVAMPWIDKVDAVLACFYPGQGGGAALAQLLFGKANPSGKLTTTLAARIQDIPGFHTYPGENGHHLYSEGIFAGYRYYDLRAVEPLFPFGHGLSYTHFVYDDLSVDAEAVVPGLPVRLQFKIGNTGEVFGQEVVQIYVRPIEPGLKRPVRELKAFSKHALAPGETATVNIELLPRDFQYFDTATGRWTLQATAFAIEVAASSRDIRLSQILPCMPEPTPAPRIKTTSSPAVVFSHPKAEAALKGFIIERLKLVEDEAQKLIDGTRQSFFGFYDALSWSIGESISEAELAALFHAINEEAPS
jgi:beta-glucosidase